MLQDGILLLDDSVISNLQIQYGSSLPSSGNNLGELFYKTGVSAGLYIYNGSSYDPVGSSSGNIDASQVTSGTFADARIAQSNVTQYQAALTILETQITDGSLLARNAGNETITGTWSFNNAVTGVSPSTANQLATKQYVDNVATGLDVKNSVRAATTANITLSGPQTIDGVSVVAADRVLVKNQTTGSQNGIYIVAAGAWTRSSDADNSPSTGEVTSGMFTFVTSGTVNGNTGFVLTTDDPITLGSTALVFTQFSAATSGVNSIIAGTNISVSSSTGNVTINTTGATLASTQVGFGSAGNLLSGSAKFTWIDGSNTLFIGSATTGAATTVLQGTTGALGTPPNFLIKGAQGAGTQTGGALTLAAGRSTTEGSGGGNSGPSLFLEGGTAGGGVGSGGSIFFSTSPDFTSSMTERFRITHQGAWGLSGANYGTSGQVLTSSGSSTAPSWTTLSTAAAAGTLTGTTLAANVVTSSLTSLGTLSSITITSSATVGTNNSTFTVTTPATSIGGQVGGAITIQGGQQNNTSSSGGNVALVGGAGAALNTTGGGATLQGGSGIFGGNAVLNGGTGTTNGGDIVFSTAPTTSLVERFRISEVGEWLIGGSAGTGTYVLTSNGAGSAPTWQASSGGGSAAAGTLTGTTLASNVVSSSLTSLGTLSALSVTGVHTQTGALNLAGASSPLQVQGAAGTSGQVLTSAGTGATPTWATLTSAQGLAPLIAHAYQGSAATTPNNTSAAIPTNTALYDPSGIVNTGNGRVIPTRAGYYQVTVSVRTTAQIHLAAQIWVNGLYRYGGVDSGAANGSQALAVGMVFLNGTTDYVQAGGFAAANSTTWVAAADGTYIEVYGPVDAINGPGLAATNTWTGANTFSNSINLSGTTSPLLLAGAPGTSGQVLTSGGAGTTPSWQNASGGTPSTIAAATTIGTVANANVTLTAFAGTTSVGSFSIIGASATGANTAGTLILQAGSSTTSGAGGATTVAGGDQTAGTGVLGGALTLRGGDQAGNGITGGAVTLRGGNNSNNGTGGTVTIAGGTGITAGGALNFQTATTTSLLTRLSISAAGVLSLPGNGTSGTFTLGGSGGANVINGLDTGNGGALTVRGGDGTNAGNVTIRGGDSSGGGATGTMTIRGGNATISALAGGAMSIAGGAGFGTGAGGAMTINAGNGGATGAGGVIAITAGNGGTGTTGGNITFSSGTAPVAGNAGNILFYTNTASPTNSNYRLKIDSSGDFTIGDGSRNVTMQTVGGSGSTQGLSITLAASQSGSAGATLTLNAGLGTGAVGGPLNINGGASSGGSVAGGLVTITGGANTAGGATNNPGGGVTIVGGAASGTAGVGGAVLLQGGAGTASNGLVQLKSGWTDTKNAPAFSATPTIALAAGNSYAVTMTANITAIAFSGVPAAGNVFTLTFFLTQDGTGSRTVVWPTSFKWQGGATPVLTTTAGKTDIFQAVTHDGGVTWYASIVGLSF